MKSIEIISSLSLYLSYILSAKRSPQEYKVNESEPGFQRENRLEVTNHKFDIWNMDQLHRIGNNWVCRILSLK